jgi:hypothetical protein
MSAGKAVAATVCACVLAGCGGNGGRRMPDVGALPLAAGSNIVARATECDRGSNAYCAIDLVVVNPRYRNSWQLIAGERRSLGAHRWTATHAGNGDQSAADSPSGKLRVTYATAYGDLKDSELGWIRRPQSIALALSRTLFDRAAAMSVTLEVGS